MKVFEGSVYGCWMMLLMSCAQRPAGFKNSDADTVSIVPVDLVRISRVTGKTLAGENLPNTGNTTKYNVGGTDLGIMWDMDDGRVGLFFGDSYGNDFIPVGGGPGKAGDWRCNLLGFSTDNNLADGLIMDSMSADSGGEAKQVIPRSANSHTIIPTAAIHISGVDYVHYFDLRSWTGWVTNFSSVYKSVDGGKTWQHVNEVIFPKNSKFSVAAYAKKDGYVYMVGTRSLRLSPPYLCRFKEADILKQSEYEYWSNISGWVKGNEAAATEIFGGTAGEPSIAYNEAFQCWIITYLRKETKNIELRTAKKITGPWSSAKTLVSASQYPGLYGRFMHPHNKGKDLYFTMSLWAPYNVFWMKATLKTEDKVLN